MRYTSFSFLPPYKFCQQTKVKPHFTNKIMQISLLHFYKLFERINRNGL